MKKVLTLDGDEQPWSVFNDAEVSKLRREVRSQLAPCKVSLEETIKLDDDEEKGFVSLEGLKESFEVMELKLDARLEDFIFFFMYSQSSDVEHIRYQCLFDLLDEVSEGSDMEDLKEQSEPEAQSQPKEPSDYEDDFSKENFEKPEKYSKEEFTKDVEEDEPSKPQAESGEPQSQSLEPEAKPTDDLLGGGSPEEIDEEEGLTIAENCFGRIASIMESKGISVKQVFEGFISNEILEMEDGSEYEIELMSPTGFLEGLKRLGVDELTEIEVQCLMLILVKPELENAIVVADLQMVMENFGIEEKEGENASASPEPKSPTLEEPQKTTEDNGPTKKKKFKFENLSAEALSALYDVAKFSQDNDLKDLFAEASYEQLVKTKKKQNVVEIIESDNFFAILQNVGVVKGLSASAINELEKFFCLDAQYQNLILIKKVTKSTEELLSQEDIIQSIMEW